MERNWRNSWHAVENRTQHAMASSPPVVRPGRLLLSVVVPQVIFFVVTAQAGLPALGCLVPAGGSVRGCTTCTNTMHQNHTESHSFGMS